MPLLNESPFQVGCNLSSRTEEEVAPVCSVAPIAAPMDRCRVERASSGHTKERAGSVRRAKKASCEVSQGWYIGHGASSTLVAHMRVVFAGLWPGRDGEWEGRVP